MIVMNNSPHVMLEFRITFAFQSGFFNGAGGLSKEEETYLQLSNAVASVIVE